MAQLSRRKFLYLGAGVAVVLGAGFAVKQEVLPQLVKPENKYPQGLSIEQMISPEILEYPPLKSDSVEFIISLTNTAPVPIENIVLKQSGLEGFKLKSVKYQDKEVDSANIDSNGDLVVRLPSETLGPKWIREIHLIYESGWNSRTSNVTLQASGRYFQEGKFGFEKGYLETASNQAQATIQVIPLPKTLAELYQQGKQDWVKDILTRKILLQYSVPAEIQEKYWRDPSEENGTEVMEYFFSELEKAGGSFSELVNELQRLPDLKNAKHDFDLVKTIENIVSICLIYETPNENIQGILDEGIKKKRKYCTTLQALFWFGKRELWDKGNNPLSNYSSMSLLQRAWTFGESEKWNDFDVVVERLNFPVAIDLYMSKNFTYYYPGSSAYREQSARETFQTRRGDCGNQSRFAQYCLAKNGYDAYWLFIQWRSDYSGHVCCLYRDKDGQWYFHDNTYPPYRGIFGPFKTAKAAFSQFLGHCYTIEPFTNYTTHIRDINNSSRNVLLW